MKSRVSHLSPEMQKYVEQVVAAEKRKIQDEATYMLMMVVMWTLLQENDWRGKRLGRFFNQVVENFYWLVKQYDDSWETAVERDLKDRAHIVYSDPQWRISLSREKSEARKAEDEERRKIFEKLTGINPLGPVMLSPSEKLLLYGANQKREDK